MQLEEKRERYEALLRKWQRSINLISPKTINDIKTRHMDDSLQIVPLIPDNVGVVCDIGSGAGFPALPLAMARPDIQVHCIESDHKKCTFLQIVSRETMCPNVTIHCGRIEKILPDLTPDLLTARALAALPQLLQWGGTIPALYLKGKQWREEVKEAEKTHQFTVTAHPSKTDCEAAILALTNIESKVTCG